MKLEPSFPSWQLWGARAGESPNTPEAATPRSPQHGSTRTESPAIHPVEESLVGTTRAAVLGTIVLAVVCCGIYPLMVFGIAQLAFHAQANGSMIVDKDGTVRGSRLLGQGFTAENYFHPRPSAAGNGYAAANSSGSNLGPTSQKLNDAIKARIAAYRAEHGLKETEAIPADAVTASASGLDPHISVRNAELQVTRVAKSRGLSTEKVLEFVRANTEAPDFRILGEPGVNVLRLNLAMDALDTR